MEILVVLFSRNIQGLNAPTFRIIVSERELINTNSVNEQSIKEKIKGAGYSKPIDNWDRGVNINLRCSGICSDNIYYDMISINHFNAIKNVCVDIENLYRKNGDMYRYLFWLIISAKIKTHESLSSYIALVKTIYKNNFEKLSIKIGVNYRSFIKNFMYNKANKRIIDDYMVNFSQSVNEIFKVLRPLPTDSTFGNVFIAKEFNIDNEKVLVKTLGRYPYVKLNEQMRMFKIEYENGMVLNQLRECIPNFMYTYAFFACPYNPRKSIRGGKKVFEIDNFCVGSNEKYPHLVLEFIEDSWPLKNIFDKYAQYPSSVTAFDILTVYLQLYLALGIAYDKCKFVHWDLHTANVLIVELNNYINITYKIGTENISIKTKFIPIIIDFGNTSVNGNKPECFTIAGQPFSHRQRDMFTNMAFTAIHILDLKINKNDSTYLTLKKFFMKIFAIYGLTNNLSDSNITYLLSRMPAGKINEFVFTPVREIRNVDDIYYSPFNAFKYLYNNAYVKDSSSRRIPTVRDFTFSDCTSR